MLKTDRLSNGSADVSVCSAWHVEGARYTHSAAQFWSRLSNEITDLAGPSGGVELSTTTSLRLSRELLFPQAVLQRDLSALVGHDLGRMMRSTLAELELFGPPAPIAWQLFGNPEVSDSGEMDAEIADSDTLGYLAAWLMEWAGIPPRYWNLPSVDGTFEALDAEHAFVYDIGFSITERLLAEGLMSRTVRFSPGRRPTDEEKRTP